MPMYLSGGGGGDFDGAKWLATIFILGLILVEIPALIAFIGALIKRDKLMPFSVKFTHLIECMPLAMMWTSGAMLCAADAVVALGALIYTLL